MRRFIVISFCIALSILQFSARPLLCKETVPGKEAPDAAVTAKEGRDQEADLAKQFEQTTSFFTELKNDKDRASAKESWTAVIENFQRIHDLQPKSAYAAASLFMLGRVTYSRYQHFKDAADLDQALKYYEEVTTLFPWHPLADDALFSQARVQLEDKKNPQEAARIFTRITTEYYTDDLMSKATEKLKSLAKDYNTPLPPAIATTANTTQSVPDGSPPAEAIELPNVKNRTYVLPVEYWSSNNYTRVVINTSRPVTFKEELLEKVGEQPRRLFIDFDKSYIEPKYRAPVPIKDGLLQQIRTAQFSPDTVRVVLDIESIKSYKI